MKNESEVQQEIQLAGAYVGCQLMRNNSGAFQDKDGRQVRYGLGNVSKSHGDRIKSSDLVGFTKVTITPDMVGREVAIFTAVEVKREDWKFSPKDKREMAQWAFIRWVKKAGGIAGFANSIEMFTDIFKEYRESK